MNKFVIIVISVLLTLVYTQMDVLSADHKAANEKQSTKIQIQSTPQESDTEPSYPLFRNHGSKYYPERSTLKATILSATMPGLGQAYADNYLKATLFLSAEIGVFALASYNIARALHYRNHDTFGTGFYDERTSTFFTKEQIESRMSDHTIRGSLFLITGIGLHIWNILDASKTAKAYNNRRNSVQMQQTDSGAHRLIFTHRF